MNILTKIFGTKNQRIIGRYSNLVKRVNELEKQFGNLSDEEFKVKTSELRKKFHEEEDSGEIKIEAFALVKAVCRRLMGERWKVCNEMIEWKMIPFDVQIMGAFALIDGNIAEMATGEGKTLVAVLPLYYFALAGKGAHLATANDYLALRDSQWMGKIYSVLGMSVGCLQDQMIPSLRQQAYQADITYAASKEFGFDYLRDHSMAHSSQDVVQRGHYFCIVDEADSILIDEARTPLIISGIPMREGGVYARLKPVIEEVIREQKEICNKLLALVDKKNVENFTLEEEGVKLYLVLKGDPSSERFKEINQDFRVAKLVRDAEVHLMKDWMRRKIKKTLNHELLYVVEQGDKNCYLTDRAMQQLGESQGATFILPDVALELKELDEIEEITEGERNSRREEIFSRFEVQRENTHALTNLLKAFQIYQKDVDYCVVNYEIVLVDLFTGRLMPGRRLMDGLHQALEAKEGLSVSPETHLIATVSVQNYFRLYEHLAGMTGTAATSSSEFKEIYKRDVVRVPTHKPMIRLDEPDLFFRTESEKYRSIYRDVQKIHETGRPILVGTVSVEKSEKLSRALNENEIPHQVLNARYHLEEAKIISQAGHKNAVTIATNMAGRGTDIQIDPQVQGGLYVIGTERHESRRIDLQLRGRGGRQGDPGTTRFYISLEDDLLKWFGKGKLVKAMKFLSLPLFHTLSRPLIEKCVDFAQSNVELKNFNMRRMLIKYDDAIDVQRKIVYRMRRELLEDSDHSNLIRKFLEEEFPEKDYLSRYEASLSRGGHDFKVMERLSFLGFLDKYWIQHLSDLERLKEGMGYRSFAVMNLISEFNRESFKMFSVMLDEVAQAFLKALED